MCCLYMWEYVHGWEYYYMLGIVVFTFALCTMEWGGLEGGKSKRINGNGVRK